MNYDLDQIPLECLWQLVEVEVPRNGARVLVAPRYLGDDLRVVAQGCQAAGVQLAEGAQVGSDYIGNLLGKMRSFCCL